MNEMTPLVAPYKGLTPYAEDDAPFFFGREVERELIIANLTVSRLTLLYGASGVGKSSVLRAGVAHRLRQLAQQNLAEHGMPEFAVVVFSAWRDDPLPALLDRIHDAVTQALNVQTLPPVPPSQALAQTLHDWTERLGGDLLIILDQFEEYFLYHPQEDGEGTFAVGFPRAVSHPDLRVNFLISIREDSLAKLDRFKGSIPNLFANYLRLRHLDRDAAREAIERPIDVYNAMTPTDGQRVGIEPLLIETILEQVETGKVVLDEALRGIGTIGTAETRIETPYLQLVLTRLWDEEMRTNSRLLRLETLTRLGGAQSIVKTHLDAVMDNLPGDEQDVAARIFPYLVTPSGTKIAHTVRDLAEYASDTEPQISSVVERLADPTIRILRPVGPALGQPTELPYERYEIFHDVLAPAILDWRTRHIQAQVERRAQQEQRRADEQTRAALVAAAVSNLDINPELSVWLALHAVLMTYSIDKNATKEAVDALNRAVQASRVRLTLSGHTKRVYRVAYSRDGTRLATASEDKTVKVWDAAKYNHGSFDG
jgi:WD domain, G-beta repeat